MSSTPSILDPHGARATSDSALAWFLFALAAIIFLVVLLIVVLAVLRRRGQTSDLAQPGHRPASDRGGLQFVIGGGLVFPVLTLTVLVGLTLRTILVLAKPANATSLTVQVIGHQFWWEVRYPGQQVVTANEIHIPAGESVSLQLTSDDVIHSFWVPQLAGKMDTIPGQPNDLEFTADTVGRYLGQCAEFCGLQHAHMGVEVVVDSPADFGRWLARRSRVPLEPASEEAATGQLVFQREACSGCHTIRGTSAYGTVGPDLTDVGSRERIGADTLLNTPKNMRDWIRDAQNFKPGIAMPSFRSLSDADVAALAAYLESLR